MQFRNRGQYKIQTKVELLRVYEGRMIFRLIIAILLTVILLWTGTFLADKSKAYDRVAATDRAPPRGRPGPEDVAKRNMNENVVTILGAGRQASSTQFAEDISNVIGNIGRSDLRILPALGQSETENILNILYRKDIDLAVVDRDILFNLKKDNSGLFANLEGRLNYVTKLYNTAIHIYAHTDIKSLEDLRGKKVSCLKEGSTIDVMCQTIFKAIKIDVEFVYDDFDEALSKVKAREIAAAATGGAQPTPGFESIKASDDLHFVPVDSQSLPNSNFTSILSSYLPIELHHADYPNMIPEGKTVSTVYTPTLLAVYAWSPGSARYKRIQKFVDLFFSNINALRNEARHPQWKDVLLETDVRGWTRFAAAEEWLKARRRGLPVLTKSIDSEFLEFLKDQETAYGAPLTPEQKGNQWSLFLKWRETIKKQQQQ